MNNLNVDNRIRRLNFSNIYSFHLGLWLFHENLIIIIPNNFLSKKKKKTGHKNNIFLFLSLESFYYNSTGNMLIILFG